MRRDPVLIPVSRQHRRLLMLAQLLKRNAPPYKGLPDTLAGKIAYASALRQTLLTAHTRYEEQVLFPFFRTAGGAISQLTDELEAEHQEIERLFQALASLAPEGILPEATAPQAALLADQLGHLLERHIRKEERELFQQVQAFFGEGLEKIGEEGG